MANKKRVDVSQKISCYFYSSCFINRVYTYTGSSIHLCLDLPYHGYLKRGLKVSTY